MRLRGFFDWSDRLDPVLAVLGFLALVWLSGCGSSAAETASSAVEPGSYPPTVARHFTSACTATARISSGGKLSRDQAAETCEAELRCLERRLTVAELAVAERKMLTGQANPAAKVLMSCVRQAIQRSSPQAD